jgi:hypothetical protein
MPLRVRCATIPHLRNLRSERGEVLVIQNFRNIIIAAALVFACTAAALGQEPAIPRATPTPKPAAPVKLDPNNLTAEQIVESAIFVYGFPGGRLTLNQIRKTTQEKGLANVTGADGKVEQVPYQRFVIRADTLGKEKIRLDQEFPSARFSLIFNDEKIYGVYNNTVFTPREDASRSFENQIVRGIEALLRYKENGSELALAPREKIMGVDHYVVDLTDKQGRKTRFYLSFKYFKVLMLTYEENGVKYKRRFYDYNYAQGTLVPFRSVLWAGDKIIEETEIGTITFGQKVDEDLFRAGT